MHVYYQELKSYMYCCDIKESEENTRNRFFNGLNPDIQAKFTYVPRSIIAVYARACSFEKHMQEGMLDHYDPFGSCTTPSVLSTNVERKTIVVRVAQPHICTKSSPSVPTSYGSDSTGKNKGTDFIPPHNIDECHVDLNISCVEIENDLVTPLILEDCATGLNVLCDQSTEIDAGMSTIVFDGCLNSSTDQIAKKTTISSAPISAVNSSINMSAPTEIISDENASCDIVESDLDHIKLVQNNEVLARIFHASSLFSIMMDPPISLSHAKNKITELTCLKSVYTPDFTFNLIGDNGVHNEF